MQDMNLQIHQQKIVLVKNNFENDGKDQWSSTDEQNKIVWYQFLSRWTFDNERSFYLSRSDNNNDYPILDVISQWSLFGDDDTNAINLILECRTASELNYTTLAPDMTTQIPTESEEDACTFPSGIIFNWEKHNYVIGNDVIMKHIVQVQQLLNY